MQYEMPPGMLAKLVVKQVRRDLAQIERHPRADMYAEDIDMIDSLLKSLTVDIPRRRERLTEMLADLAAEEMDWIDSTRKIIAAIEGKLDAPEDMGTRRE